MWHRSARWGLGLIIAASVLTIFVAFAGPSASTLIVGPRHNLLPPWYLPTAWFWIPEWVAVSLLWVAVAIGAVGLWLCLRAWSDGWHPRNNRLLALGLGLNIATALVPPVTSSDVLMYAAYGRLQVLGRDPYKIGPADVFRVQYDPVIMWVERPWQDTPSVYGPIASFSQLLANWLGGAWMHDIVFWLQVMCIGPLIGVGLLCWWMTRSDPHAQTRALLLTLCNPCLIWSVAAGAHNEALGVVFAIAGFALLRRSPFAAGVGVGLSGCVKVSMVFYGLACCWAYRREPRKLVAFAAGAAVPIVICYGLAPEALLAASRNLGYTSPGGWFVPVLAVLTPLMGAGPARTVITVTSWILLVVLAWALNRILPWLSAPGLDATVDPRRDPLTVGARTTVILCAAWLFSSGYTLAWYDLIAWAPLALIGATKVEGLLTWRGTWLSLGFVTGRVITFSAPIYAIGVFFRNIASPAAQWVVLIAVVGWALRRRPPRAVTSGEQWIGAHPTGRRFLGRAAR